VPSQAGRKGEGEGTSNTNSQMPLKPAEADYVVFWEQAGTAVYYTRCSRCTDLAYLDGSSGQCLRCKADEEDRANCASGIRGCDRYAAAPAPFPRYRQASVSDLKSGEACLHVVRVYRNYLTASGAAIPAPFAGHASFCLG
jgi:hypothetical protein